MDIFAVNLCTQYSDGEYDLNMMQYRRIIDIEHFFESEYNLVYIKFITNKIKQYGCVSITTDMFLIDIDSNIDTSYIYMNFHIKKNILDVYNKLKAERRKQNLKDLGY